METWPYTTHHPLVSFGRDCTIGYGYLLADTYKKKKKREGSVHCYNFMYIILQKEKQKPYKKIENRITLQTTCSPL